MKTEAVFYYKIRIEGGEMPKARNPNREKAFEIYKKHKGEIDLVEIASQLNLAAGTVRGWKSKDKWDEKMNACGGWNSFYWSNHDQARAVTRFGDESPEYRVISAKMLGALHIQNNQCRGICQRSKIRFLLL